MDSGEALTDLIMLCGIGFVVLMVAFYVQFKIKGRFGFRGSKTGEHLARLSGRSKVGRHSHSRWNTHSGSKRGLPPLERFLLACESGDVNEVTRLISAGINVNATRRPGGKTGLMLASAGGHVDTVRILLMRRAEVNITGGVSGKTALMRAAESGKFEVVRLLLGYGAEINCRSTATGKTALMGAVENGSLEMAHFLIDAGADVNAKNKHGKTAADTAFEKGLDVILTLLRVYGADFNKYGGNEHEEPPTSSVDQYYAVLECKKTDSIEVIKAKYRTLVKQYHPDVIQGKGLPADFIEFANEKFQLIREAYQHIIRHHR